MGLPCSGWVYRPMGGGPVSAGCGCCWGSSLLGFSAPSQAEWVLQSGAGQDLWVPPLWWELGVQHLAWGLKDKLHRGISSLP